MPLVPACQVGTWLSSVQSGETESYGNSRARIQTESRERPPAVRNSIPEVLGAQCGMQVHGPARALAVGTLRSTTVKPPCVS